MQLVNKMFRVRRWLHGNLKVQTACFQIVDKGIQMPYIVHLDAKVYPV